MRTILTSSHHERWREEKVRTEPHSPYYLHPSEGPGAMITVVLFDEKNYDLWERAIRTALKAKNKLGFIDRTLVRPTIKDGDEFFGTDAWDMRTTCYVHGCLMSSTQNCA